MYDVLKAFEELDSLDESVNTNIIYHRTAPKSAINILNENILRVGGNYLFNHTFGQCICFSRDYNFIKNMPGNNYVIFVLDRDKLTTRYKLEPITDYKNTNNFKGRYIGDSKAEEICFKDIIIFFHYNKSRINTPINIISFLYKHNITIIIMIFPVSKIL